MAISNESIYFALTLTILAGGSTTIGAFLGVINKKPSRRFISFIMAFSGGVMIFLSFAEMFNEAEHTLGMSRALPFLALGLGIGMLIDILLPHEENVHDHLYNGNGKKIPNDCSKCNTPFNERQMGCIIQNKMIYCASCGKEFRYNKEEINEESLIKKSNDPIIQNPEVMKKQKHGNHRHGKHRHGNPRHATHGHGKNKHRGPERHRKKHQHQWKEYEAKQIMRLGMLTVIALFIHNLPEGLATFSASLINPALGIEIAFATALHNIPEGISVAVPIYSASGSKGKAILYATLSGLAEPVGAVLAWLILAPILSTDILNFMLAFTAGVMVYVSVDVLIPTAKTLEHKHTMIIGFSLGAIVMGISLIFL